MKKFLFLSVASVALSAFSARAQTPNANNADASAAGMYGVGQAALSFVDDSAKDLADGAGYGDFDVGNGGFNIGVGYRLNDLVRAELTYNYRGGAENEKTIQGAGVYSDNKYSVTTSGVMLNGYVDIPVGGTVTPYVGAGVGFTDVEYMVEFEGTGGKGKRKVASSGFSYGFAAGVGIEMNERVAWDVGYRYVNHGSFKKHGGKFATAANEVLIGARYSF